MRSGIVEKLDILADAAKYDVSCSSSGSKRKNESKGLGTTGNGICHAYTEDGRCVSLLKILLTNHCIYDCLYCINRKSNDIKRAAFTVEEVVDLTISFYRRNYIEGLFLSSGIFTNADYTMERLVRIARKLRTEHNFNGYIHLKTIPAASEDLLKEAALYADRLSINVEMPTEQSLKLLAPEKNHKDVVEPMKYLRDGIVKYKDEKKHFKKLPLFAPAGQTTQMVIGATPDSDLQILATANYFYKQMNLKRVYYSGYVPISDDSRLPVIGTPVPVIRENRLYQADWLFRFYGFNMSEIVNKNFATLELDIDPKLSWALRNMHYFPVDINTADYAMILRVPGIGVVSAKKIVAARKFSKFTWDTLGKLGVSLQKVKHFIVCTGLAAMPKDISADKLRSQIINLSKSKYKRDFTIQTTLF
jgi:putative DNA modification/repair radical SAM protein